MEKKPPLDSVKLPTDAIIVVVENPAAAINLLSGSFKVLAGKEAQQVLDDFRRREKAMKEARETPGRITPSTLHIEGRAEGDRAFIKATFGFATDRPRTVVALGLKPAQVNSAELRDADNPDGKPRFVTDLRSEADGLNLYLNDPEPKDYRLTLELTLALSPQAAPRSLELRLPRAAATTLDFTLPTGAHDLRLPDDALLKVVGRSVTGTLGAAERLALSWKEGKTVGVGTTVLEAEGRTQVRLDGRSVRVETHLTLKARGGTDQWEILVPPGGEVEVDLEPADKGRLKKKTEQAKPFASLRTLQLKEVNDEPLHVAIVVKRVIEPGARAPVPVGPFVVLGAIKQTGTIVITSAGKGGEPRLDPHGDTTQREPTGAERSSYPEPFLRVFKYEQVPQPTKPTAAFGESSYSLLDISPSVVRGLVQTNTKHTLKMEWQGEGKERVIRWIAYTRIEVELIRQGTVDQIEILLPAGSRLLETARPGPVIEIPKPENGKVILKLTAEPWKQFAIDLQFAYDGVPGDTKGESTFELPRVSEAAFGSKAEVTVVVPREVELVMPERPGATMLTSVSAHEMTWRSDKGGLDAERPPAAIDVAWRPFRPDVRADAFVYLTTPEGQATVRHELHYRFPPSPRWAEPPPVTINLPKGLEIGTFEIASGGKLLSKDGGSCRVQLNATGANRDTALVLKYTFRLPAAREDGDTTFAVPLIEPKEVGHGGTRVRVWCEPGTLPELARNDAGWVRLNIEKVRNEPLPVLVLQSPRVDAPLGLRLAALAGPPVTVLADRALIRVEVTEGEGHRYSARFLLTQLKTQQLDVEMPAPVSRLLLKVTLDGRPVTHETLDEDGKPSGSGHIARLRLSPEMVKRSVLEVRYTVPPGQVSDGLFRTTLQPPVLRGEPGRVFTRWQVTLPTGWVPLGPEGGAGTPTVWTRNGFLFVPRLGVSSADMERWFAGNENVRQGQDSEPALTPSLIVLRSGLESLAVTHAPYKPWLGCCSLAVLLVGLGMYFLARRAGRGSPGWFWVSLTGLASGIGALWLFRPTTLAAVAYGAELGGAVLVVFGTLLWLVHERQRRQIVFLPSFRRGRGGSSLLRSSGSNNAPKPPSGEPATVDAPRPAPSHH